MIYVEPEEGSLAWLLSPHGLRHASTATIETSRFSEWLQDGGVPAGTPVTVRDGTALPYSDGQRLSGLTLAPVPHIGSVQAVPVLPFGTIRVDLLPRELTPPAPHLDDTRIVWETATDAPPAPLPRLERMAWIGDSWSRDDTMGAGYALPEQVAGIYGVTSAKSAAGGTGLARSSQWGDAFEAQSRITEALASDPSVLIVAGSLNSYSVVGADGAAIRAAVRTLVQRVRASHPDLPIILTGPQQSSAERDAARASWLQASAIRAEVQALGDPHLAFTDWGSMADGPITAWGQGSYQAGDRVMYAGRLFHVTAPWTIDSPTVYPGTVGAPVTRIPTLLTGAGTAGAPAGDGGTRDMWLQADGTHPTTPAGAVAAAQHLAAHLYPHLARLLSDVRDVRGVWQEPADVLPAPAPGQGLTPVDPGDGIMTLTVHESQTGAERAGLLADMRPIGTGTAVLLLPAAEVATWTPAGAIIARTE